MSTTTLSDAWATLRTISDPELPVLSIVDLGMVRSVRVEDTTVDVQITPTYSGCPALSVIALEIKVALAAQGFQSVTVTEVLLPAWTTDWMTEAGKEALRQYGIAPPVFLHKRIEKILSEEKENIKCPRCDSQDTEQLSEFGATACKALWRCKTCREPFDYFKCH